MNTTEILKEAVARDASDLFVIVGIPVSYKAAGRLLRMETQRMNPADTELFVREIYALAGLNPDRLRERGDDDFSFYIAGVSRFRASVYRQRGSLAAVVRVVRFNLPDPHALGIPDSVLALSDQTKGLVLVTGPAGSGKSTTLACLIDRINHTRSAHIITLEDPLEFLHRHDRSIVSQREVNLDTQSYVTALRAALRQAPDVILLGEMRDYETIGVAMTAAETGHLVFSTMHTVGAANSVDRIIDVFPAEQQPQVRVQLAQVLRAVVSQQLIPSAGGGIAPAFEVMTVNTAIRNMIRESKLHQIDTVIQSSAAAGMRSMDLSLLEMVSGGVIAPRDALLYAINPEVLSRRLEAIPVS